MLKEDIDVCIVCETWLKDGTNFKIRGYNTYTHNRSDGYGGVAVITKNKYTAQQVPVPSLEPIEVLELTLEHRNETYTFTSIYIPPAISNSQIATKFKDLFQKYANRPRLFLGGDFNAHHSLWDLNTTNSDARGNILAHEITHSNLVLLNDGNPTYFRYNNSSSAALDLSIISQDYAQNVQWQVLADNIGSDHLPILCTLGQNDQRSQIKVISRINLQQLADEVPQIDFSNATSITDFEAGLHHKLVECTKTFTTNAKYSAKPWWNPKLERLWKLKRIKQRFYFRNKTAQAALDLKRCTAAFKREAIQQKQYSWNSFLDSINPTTNIRDIYRKVNLFNPCKARVNQASFLDSNQKLHAVLDYNYSIHGSTNTDMYAAPQRNDEVVDSNQIYDLIRNLNNTAPGINNISNAILKLLTHDQTRILATILQNMWNNQDFPASWKQVKVIPILKPGKDRNKIESFRIISLLNVIYKLFNKYLQIKINEIVNLKRIIPKHSFGFRKGTGINEFGISLVNQIEINNANKYVSVLLSIDLEKAFDKVKTKTMIDILRNYEIEEHYLYWIFECLNNRHIHLKQNDFSASTVLNDGLPQGDILSPLLFNIYSAELHSLENNDIQVLQYADDFTFLIRDRNALNLIAKTNTFLISLTSKLATLNFNININKTHFMCINNKDNTIMDIKLNHISISEVNTIKILGITYDRKLNFERHYKETKEKCARFINIFKTLNYKRGGAHPSTMLNVYKATIASRLLYGSPITFSSRKANHKLLQVISNSALRVVLGVTNTSPTPAVLAEAATWPVMYLQEQNATNFIIKHLFKNTDIGQTIRDRKSTKSINSIYLKYETILVTLPTVTHFRQSPRNISVGRFVPSYDRNNTNYENRAAAIAEISLHTFKQKVYTDASLLNNRVGIGIYIAETEEKFSIRIRQDVSIKTAEIIAIMTAIKLMINLNCTNIIVLTDSLSSCVAVKNTLETNNDNYYEQIIIQLASKYPNINILIQWIPAHVGINGNEQADRLAGEACLGRVDHHYVEVKRPPGDTKTSLKNILHSRWATDFKKQTETVGRHFAQILSTPQKKSWFSKSKLKTRDIRLINRLRSGHCYDKKYLKMIKKIDSDHCDRCNTQDTAGHMIQHCTQYTNTRHNYTHITQKGLLQILHDTNDDELQEVANFNAENHLNL